MTNYTLDSVVKEYCIQIGDTTMSRYARFYSLAVSFLRENNMDMTGLVSVVDLPINDNDTADLPPDYLQYRIIGLCGQDGKIHSLGRNDKLCQTDCCCDDDNTLVAGANVNPGQFTIGSIEGLTQSWRNGEFIGKMFGVNGGNNANGEFRIDLKSGTIHFGGLRSNTSSVMMEYIADINAINGDFNVHPYYIETLKAFVYWKSIQMDRNFGLGDKQLAEKNYYNADRWSKRRFEQATISEWSSAFRSGNTASTKW